LPRQGTDAATVNVVVNNKNDELSLTSKLVITSIALAAAGIGLAAGFQLVRWGSRLRDDIDAYRIQASKGELFDGNYDSMLQRGSTYTNRLSYWMVKGRWGGFFPNDRDPNSVGQVINKVIELDKDVKNALASANGGALALLPSAPGAPLLADGRLVTVPTIAPGVRNTHAYWLIQSEPNPRRDVRDVAAWICSEAATQATHASGASELA
jgi:hypothetical protein